MSPLEKALVLVVAGTVLATSAFPQTARDIRGGSPRAAPDRVGLIGVGIQTEQVCPDPAMPKP